MKAAKREAAVRGGQSPLRVLLVEDNEIDAIVARAAVEKAVRGPLKIQRATTLQKSLVILGSGQVDLVLLDLNLPDSRGVDTLKSMGMATSCPIIVITAEERPGLDEEALGNGAFEILHKGRLGTDTIARLLRLAEERHRVQESLENIEHRYRQLIDVAPDAIFVHSDWRIVLVNPAMLRMFRAERPEQLLGRGVLELIAPESREMVRARIQHLYEEQGLVPLAEVEYLRSDGTLFSAEVTAASFIYSGRPAAQVVARDITERKWGEALLSGEKQVLEMIARGAPLDESLAALVRVLEAQSPGMLCSVLLLDPDGVHLRHGAAPSLPEDYTRAIDGLAIGASVGSCGTAAFRREPVIVEDVATDPLWADYRELASRHGLRACWSTPIFDPQGGVLGTLAMYYREPGSPTAQNRWLIDFATQLAAIAITRRQAEAGVVEAKQRLENALESSEAAVWVTDLRTNEVWLSAGWAAYLGKPRADTRTTVAEMLTHIHPDDHRAIAATNAQVTKGEVSSYVVEYRVKSADGWKWIASRGRVIERDADGHPLRSSGACANITPRKRAEEARDHARSRLELALAASRVCIWDYDLASGDVVLSESWAELIGAPPGETRTTIKALTELVHPDDFESLRRTLSDVAKGLCAEYAVEHRVCDRTGAWRWIVSRGKVIERDARGRAVRVVGTILDIGERKRAEQLLTLEHAVTHSLTESRDAAGAVRGAIQAICESEHWECCRYLWVDAAAGLLRAGEAWSVPDANIERYVEDSRAMVYAPGVGLVGKVWQSQEPLWVPDIANDPRVARPGLAQATGMRASLVVPVAAESRIIGVLIFHSRQVREPDPALLLKIRLIGGQPIKSLQLLSSFR